MSRIKSKDTKIEKTLERELKKARLHFEKHFPIYGTPDFVLIDEKVAVFCDSDFWHGKIGKEKFRKMKKFWKQKIINNVKRDKKVNSALKSKGWKVVRLSEKNIMKNPEKCIEKIMKA